MPIRNSRRDRGHNSAVDAYLKQSSRHGFSKTILRTSFIIILLIFRKTINAETVMFAVVQFIRGATIAVIKQYSHFLYYDF